MENLEEFIYQFLKEQRERCSRNREIYPEGWSLIKIRDTAHDLAEAIENEKRR